MDHDLAALFGFSRGPRKASGRLKELRNILAEAFAQRGLSFDFDLRERSVCLDVWRRLSTRLAVIARVTVPRGSDKKCWEFQFEAFVANVLYLDEPIALMTPVEIVFVSEYLTRQELVDMSARALAEAHLEFQRDLLIEKPGRLPI